MIQVCDNFEQLSHSVAELFAEQARLAVAARGCFCVALAGGSTPRHSYQLLALPPFRDQIPWSQVHVFWGDERCVPADDLRSNALMAREALLDKVPIPTEQIYPMASAQNPHAAALAYQILLQKFFHPEEPRFDLILLGLGADGHTASLIPGTTAPLERVSLVTPLQVPGEDFARLSLTLPTINRARMVVFLVSGQGKAKILHQVQTGPPKRFPAQLIAPDRGEIRWLVDKDAAGQDNNDTLTDSPTNS